MDIRSILQLARNIASDVKTLTSNAEELRARLSALEGTFHDGGFDEVNNYSKALISLFVNTQEALIKVTQQLIEYAELLRLGKGLSNGIGTPLTAFETSSSIARGTSIYQVDLPGVSGEIKGKPRDLPVTQQIFVDNGKGEVVYNTPNETGNTLYSSQGSAYTNFLGTCGLCSCANVLRLSGVFYDEKDVIDYAATTRFEGRLFSKLCTYNPLDAEKSGGTIPEQRKEILSHFGIDSSVIPVVQDTDGSVSIQTIEMIGNSVSTGRGVIIDVDCGVFYNDPRENGYGHAVTVISVTKNKYGDVSGFYIADSNQGTVYCPAWLIQQAMRPWVGINVTNQIIR